MPKIIAMLALVLVSLPPMLWAQNQPVSVNSAKARTDYILECGGCHGIREPVGNVMGEIPNLKEKMGVILQNPQGRDYLVRVAGAMNSKLDAEALANVYNWLLTTYNAQTTPNGFHYYSPADIEQARAAPPAFSNEIKKLIVSQLAEQGIDY